LNGALIISLQSLSKGFKAIQSVSKVLEKKIFFPKLGQETVKLNLA
jgi:hypothetical protein